MSLFDEHKAERRERILAAARTLVAERGYEGLTMRDLARAAKVSVPTLYSLFGSKDAIIVTELEAMASSIARALQATGQLAEWAEPAIVARHMYTQQVAGFLAWGRGQVDFATFRAGTLSACAHILAGVARGAFAAEVETQIKNLSTPLRHLIAQEEARHVATRR